MTTQPLANSATAGAASRRVRTWVLNGAVLLIAGGPAVGSSQSVVSPDAPLAPAVGVAPQVYAASPHAMAVPTQQPPQAPPAVLSPVPAAPLAEPALLTARVLSVASMAQPAGATRLVCSDMAEVPAPTSGAGAIAGALVGAAVGSQMGGGAGNALATAAGFLGGALIGDKAEQGGRTQTMRQCLTHSGVGPSLAYQVTYEFGGQQYSTVLPYHPGATLQVQVTSAVAGTDGTPGATIAATPPIPVAVTHTVVMAAPAYGYYGPYGYSAYAPYWGAPVVVGIGVGRYWGGRHYRGGHGHGHRRW